MSDIDRLTAAVSAAKLLVDQCQEELRCKEGEVRASLPHEEVLSDLPNLLEMYLATQDISSLEKRSEGLQLRLAEERKRLLGEARKKHPCPCPELADQRDYLSWLIRELRPGTDLTALLRNPRLRARERKAIQWALASKTPRHDVAYVKDHLWMEMRNVCESYDRVAGAYDAELEAIINPQLQSFLQEAKNAQAELARARMMEAALALAEPDIACREHELVEQRTGGEREKLQQAVAVMQQVEAALSEARRKEAEDRERLEREARRKEVEERERRELAWWAGFAARPLSELVPRLQGISGDQAEAALGRILQMDMGDPYLHDQGVQAFLRCQCHRRKGTPALLSPAFIALLGRLSLEDRNEARRLRTMLPEGVMGVLTPVIDYLDFVLADGPLLTGITSFDSLNPEDLYLAACYWGQGDAAFAGITYWDYRSVEGALDCYGHRGWDTSPLNMYKVWGLQPRIAELALREVCRRLQSSQAAEQLRDLNLQVVECLRQPWAGALQEVRHNLPGADWQDQQGRKYDVKCNLFFYHLQEKEGLRGLFIEPGSPLGQHHYYPGFIFFDSTDQQCSWCYIGTYRHDGQVRSERVCPFLFRLPSRCRFEIQGDVPPVVLITAAHLLNDWRLLLGWYLAARKAPAGCHANYPAHRMLDEVVSRCAVRYREQNLEVALWRAVTEVALEGCSDSGPASVDDFLFSVGQLIRSAALPLRLPRLGEELLLGKWIDNILKPIIDNWGEILCSRCGQNGRSGAIQLGNIVVTSKGSINGEFNCRACGERKAGVRILTHCRGCGRYPLLIGVNELCSESDCGGLVCRGTRTNGARCLHCKTEGCPGLRRRQQEQLAHRPLPPSDYGF
jgi:hypothetical protein